MRTEHEIYMDFRRAVAQAEKLRMIAHRMRRVSQDEMEMTLRILRSCWSGMNSEIFQRKGQITQDEIMAIADHIQQAANVVEEIAHRTMVAEMQAIEIAGR